MAMEEGALAKVKLVAAVLVLEMLIAGFHVVSRAALDMGVSKMAFLVYRNGSALLVIAPVAYFLEKKERPPLTLRLMIDFFMLAAVGVTFTQGLYILGLYYLSPTYVSVIQNSVPAITFVMAAVLRIEQVNIKSRHGLAKIAGTVITIAGATIITLYKGMPLTTTHSVGTHKLKDIKVILSPRFTWIAGCLIMFVNCLCLSGWMVLQKVSSIWTIRSITLSQVSSITWKALIKMPSHPRLSAAQYVARFKPQEPYEDGEQELSDAESRVGDTPMENVVMGWTTKFHIMVPKADAFFHDMLTRTLDNYYYDWEATLEYRSAEYSHPWMDSYWETELWVKKRDPTTKEPKVESKFITRVSRATVEISMEDVAFNAFVYYHGLRSDKTLKGALRHFPCFLHDKGIWTVPPADDSSLTLQATVGLARELALHEVDLKDELLKEKELKEQAYKEIDQLRAELGRPKIYEKLN